MWKWMFTLPLLGLLFAGSSGCAVYSLQELDLSYQPDQHIPAAGLEYKFHSNGHGLAGWPFSHHVMIPFVLHFEYERPPWRVWTNIVDNSGEFRTLQVDCVQLSWGTSGDEELFLVSKACNFRRSLSGDRTAMYFIDREIDRAEPVHVHIKGRLIRADGSEVPVEFGKNLQPHEIEGTSDIFSFYASC